MDKNEMFKYLKFSTDYSTDDWNTLTKNCFNKYIPDSSIFEKNKEILRTELINYVNIVKQPELFKLFEWIFSLLADCVLIDRLQSVKELSGSFHETSKTDSIWMANVLTQSDTSKFSERDKINYSLKFINEVLEGGFKPRFTLLHKFACFKSTHVFIDNSNFDFGKLVSEFPKQFLSDAALLLTEPISSIATNQWRNIAAHKSFVISKNKIDVKYGKLNRYSASFDFETFYKIFQWAQDIYRSIRLAQVLIYINHMPEIIVELGGVDGIQVRFEASLMNLIHNMQIVGFEFISTEEQPNTFCLNVKSKIGFDLNHSVIHASQCLDQLCCAIHDDEFVRDNFQKTRINVMDRESNAIASATVSISIALKMAYDRVSVEDYIAHIQFEMR